MTPPNTSSKPIPESGTGKAKPRKAKTPKAPKPKGGSR